MRLILCDECGVDEAGRGALAGPVVAAAVILPKKAKWKSELADSKKLSAKKREELFDKIMDESDVSIAIINHRIILKINILHASLLAMRKAVLRLSCKPNLVLVDGNKAPKLSGYNLKTVVNGDQLHPCISAASIIAKVSRDRLMIRNDQRFPGYGFFKHKGYGTMMHYEKLKNLGASPIHRQGFKLFQSTETCEK